MTIFLLLLGGLALLVLGGELLVRGSVNVASRLGVSPLVIGLTLVGFGTSTPELVTSVQAALAGAPGIAYGNIVGSNIANILLILGVATLLLPITVESSTLKRDGAVMVAVAVVFAIIAATMPAGRLVGAVFVAALCAYIYTAFRQESRAGAEHGAVYDKSIAAQEADGGLVPAAAPKGSVILPLLMALGGLAVVVLGGKFFVDGAVALARTFDISETVIGLTIVALGTSMPELVTSVMAALRKQTDVAFGNIVGSNIYNVFGILGVTAMVKPIDVPPEIADFDIWVMLAATVLLFLVALSRWKITRLEGGVMLASYAAYVGWLGLNAGV